MPRQLVAHDVLDAEVDRQPDRLEVACPAAKPGSVQVGQALPSMYFSMPAMPWLSMLTRPTMCEAVGPPG